MAYKTFRLVVLFEGMEEAKIFEDLVAVDANAALGDIASAYGETPELLGYTDRG